MSRIGKNGGGYGMDTLSRKEKRIGNAVYKHVYGKHFYAEHRKTKK